MNGREVHETETSRLKQAETYAVKHKDDKERLRSQSGGVFPVLSDTVLSLGGVVYGCVFDDQFRAIHIRAKNKKDRDRMRYSKYVQSAMGDVFRSVLADLEAGETVLFSGTSCQVAGLNRYLSCFSGKIRGMLYTVDIVCHGVPSPGVWRDYLNWESEKAGAGLRSVVCRDKTKYVWKSHVTTLLFQNGKRADRKVFTKLFYSHVILRPACYQCPYKSTVHPSDITIADYWGIDKASPGFRDEKGVSLVLVNTKAGKELFSSSDAMLTVRSTRIEDSLQEPLVTPCAVPENRSAFWNDYHRLKFDSIARSYGNFTLSKELKWKAMELAKKLLR